MNKPSLDDAIKHLVQRMELPSNEHDSQTYFCGALDMLTMIYGEPLHRIRQLYTDCKTTKKIVSLHF
jgi:hypothetical protein